MSAIFGIISLQSGPLPPTEIEQMQAAYETRYTFDRIAHMCVPGGAIGCMHQIITSEATRELLPMHDATTGIYLTADAILDHRPDLENQLGLSARTAREWSDAELIGRAYLKWGTACVDYLYGHFAFALFDERKQSWLLVRDQLGARTLFYAIHQQRIYFATTERALRAVVPTTISELACQRYFLSPYQVDHQPEKPTFFNEVTSLPPANLMQISNGHYTIHTYWELTPPAQVNPLSEAETIDTFLHHFEQATRSCLRTRGSVGILLSGGLDSTAVAAMAAPLLQETQQTLAAYTHVPHADYVHDTDKLINERPFVEDIIQMYPNITPHWLEMPEQNAWRMLAPCLQVMEQPYVFFSNAYWLLHAFQFAQQAGHKIMLNGKNGNGSISYGAIQEMYAHWFRQHQWRKLAQELIHQRRQRQISWWHALKIVLYNAWWHQPAQQIEQKIGEKLRGLLRPEFVTRLTLAQRPRTSYSPFEGVKQHLSESHRHERGVNHTMLSLHYGVISRDPTADIRLVEWIATLPDERFLHQGIHKRLHRLSFAQRLPASVIHLKRYKGLQAQDWLFRLQPHIEELYAAFRDSMQEPLLRMWVTDEVADCASATFRTFMSEAKTANYIFKLISLARFLRESRL